MVKEKFHIEECINFGLPGEGYVDDGDVSLISWQNHL